MYMIIDFFTKVSSNIRKTHWNISKKLWNIISFEYIISAVWNFGKHDYITKLPTCKYYVSTIKQPDRKSWLCINFDTDYRYNVLWY